MQHPERQGVTEAIETHGREMTESAAADESHGNAELAL
jgi:hypothetical protein